MMRVLSILVLLTLSSVSSATVESTGRICGQGAKIPDECPNNNIWNSRTCKFECQPHCISNEGNFIFPGSYGTTYYRQCQTCTCNPDGTTSRCSPKLCVNKCFDDAGNTYAIGEIMNSGCKTGKCTSVNGKATWSWYSPASAAVKPNCPYGPGVFNNATCKWECPSTCPDGSSPRKCAQGGVPLPPCSVVRCGFNTECTDNYCPNYPNNNQTACTATCVKPALCTKDPCQTTPEKPKCGKNQQCKPDYRFGCGYQCEDITCVYNEEIFQVGDNRKDDCNTCSCLPNGGWACTKKACPKPEPTCPPTQVPRCDFGPAVLNSTSCKYYCPPTCADGSVPVACTINPCASALCARNTQCRANYCGGCNAECKTIQPDVQCFARPCQVNSCDHGQTCVDEYDGGCNYRCI